MGVVLKSEECLSVLNHDFRPWPRVHDGDAVSANFYARLEKNKVADMEELNSYTTRVDVLRYTEVPTMP
jgi:hypothetical protein